MRISRERQNRRRCGSYYLLKLFKHRTIMDWRTYGVEGVEPPSAVFAHTSSRWHTMDTIETWKQEEKIDPMNSILYFHYMTSIFFFSMIVVCFKSLFHKLFMRSNQRE